MKTTTATTLCLLLTTLAPLAGAGSGGGTVSNVSPTVQSFSGDRASVDNNGAIQETYTLQVQDANGEADIQGVRVSSTNAGFGTATFSPVACGSPPAGWTCTDATPNDGVLVFTYRFTWATGTATGTYTQTPAVKDEGSYLNGATEATQVTTSAILSFNAGQVYDSAGATVAQNWGAWSISPSASSVSATNYLKAVNTGNAAGSVSLNFQETMFSGPGGGLIGIDSNLKFCTAATTDTAPQPPSGLTFSCDASASTDGSRTVSIGSHATVWISYLVVSIPAIAPDGAYTATYSGA